jgi:acyl-CoA thioester hydrolase
MIIPVTAPGQAPDTQAHVLLVRVYWEDTDAGGIVYYANYLRYVERARSELLRDLGVTSQRALADDTGLVFAVRRLEADYLASARLDDMLDVVTQVIAVHGAVVDMEQIVRRDGRDLVRMKVQIACVNDHGRATRVPDWLARAFANYVRGTQD